MKETCRQVWYVQFVFKSKRLKLKLLCRTQGCKQKYQPSVKKIKKINQFWSIIKNDVSFFPYIMKILEQQKLQNIYVIEVHMKYLGSKLKFPGFTASELSKGNNWHKNTTKSQQFSVLAQTL